MSLLLVNYRHAGSELGKSITSLPLEEAIKIADKLYNNSPCKAHRRFGSAFVRYYEDRIKVERWLYDRCLQIGVRPKIKHPLYFTLRESKELSDNFGEYQEFKLNLDEIADEDISFTLGDSMALYYEGELGHVFTKKELLEQVESAGPCKDSDDFFGKISKQCAFIEVQLWNMEYLTG